MGWRSSGVWWSVAFTAWVLACPVAGREEIRLKGIKGDDNRIIVEAREYPWSAIGRLNNGLGGYCSGALIGPRLVLTAAHCLWNHKTKRWLAAESLHFVAGYSRGEYLAHDIARTFTTAPGFSGGGRHSMAPGRVTGRLWNCMRIWGTGWVTSAWSLSVWRK